MAFLPLTQTHSKYIEWLSRFIWIIFQHPAQDICPSRTTPALPSFRASGRDSHQCVLTCALSNCEQGCFTVSSFTTISRWQVFSRPSGESLTALPTVPNTRYHACSYVSLIGWRLKSTGVYFFISILFLNIFPLSPKIKQNYECNSTRNFSYSLKRIVVYRAISDVHWKVPCQFICDILRAKSSR